MNIRLGYRLLRDHRVPIRAKLMALGIGAACIGALELLQLPLEAVLAAILPLIGITGDIAFDGAEAVVGPVIIATMLLPVSRRAASPSPNPRGRRTGARFLGKTFFGGGPQAAGRALRRDHRRGRRLPFRPRFCNQCFDHDAGSGTASADSGRVLRMPGPKKDAHGLITEPSDMVVLLRWLSWQSTASASLFSGSNLRRPAIAADPKHLGAKIGFFAVLHTWG